MEKVPAAKIQMYVGTRSDGKGYTEMEYNPHEMTVIFRDHRGQEIRLDPQSIRQTITELTAFAATLERIGIKTKA